MLVAGCVSFRFSLRKWKIKSPDLSQKNGPHGWLMRSGFSQKRGFKFRFHPTWLIDLPCFTRGLHAETKVSDGTNWSDGDDIHPLMVTWMNLTNWPICSSDFWIDSFLSPKVGMHLYNIWITYIYICNYIYIYIYIYICGVRTGNNLIFGKDEDSWG